MTDVGAHNLATAIVWKAVEDYKENVKQYVKDKRLKPKLAKDYVKLLAEWKEAKKLAYSDPTEENIEKSKQAQSRWARVSALQLRAIERARKIDDCIELFNSEWCYELGYDGRYILKTLIQNGYDYRL